MAQHEGKSDDKYRSLRNEFDDLQLEEKAVFLIESGLSLFIHSIDSLTRFVRDEVNKMTESSKEEDADDEEGADSGDDSDFARDIASEDDTTHVEDESNDEDAGEENK